MMVPITFFNRDALVVARALLGKVLRVKYKNVWLAAIITATEAYYKCEKASHSSLGFTPKRRALFMPPGTIYMYHSHGGDSLNVSARGAGNAVLIKEAFPFIEDAADAAQMLALMRQLNPQRNSQLPRPIDRLCAGQALLCKSLGLRRTQWDQHQFVRDQFYIDDVGYVPKKVMSTTRLGIPKGRDEHLPYRLVVK